MILRKIKKTEALQTLFAAGQISLKTFIVKKLNSCNKILS